GPQRRALQAGAQVVVGTPGRVLDLLNQRFLQFPWTEFAVLDEADKMLEIGFIDDVKKILDACNEYRQTLLFSATFPPPLLELARGYTTDPIEIATASGVATVDSIHQYFLRCSEEDRARELSHLIEDSGDDDRFLVFCERRTDVDRLMRQLERRRFSVKALHGGYDQAARFRVMGAFRTGDVKCLVATDVASRGLDVAHVTHVVNLGVPRDVSDYTHRIGRTGRAGRDGVAVTFVSRRNERDWKNIEGQSGFDLKEIRRPRELYAIERRRRRGDEEPQVVESESRTEEERPRRGRRRLRSEDGESRGGRREESRSSERKADGERKPRRERKPKAHSEPSAAAATPAATPSGPTGFGAGLEPEPTDGGEERSNGRRKRRSRRRDESAAKDRSDRPKRTDGRQDDGAPDPAPAAESPTSSSGFGAGL
ncbi:MAG: DEAD/DEAH box helicase, partial [Planctomycetota bacterium]